MTAPTQTQPAQYVDGGSSHKKALSVLTMLFFAWGFLTVLNDLLIPHLKKVFSLGYAEAMLIQFCFFGSYLIFSIPASGIIARTGYKRAIVLALLLMGVSCLAFYPAAHLRSFPAFLGALFALGTGITLLQVAANPYVSILGPPEGASSRLNLAQAFNSLGTLLAPLFGSYLILGHAQGTPEEEAAAVQIPYFGLALALAGLAAFVYFAHLPNIETEQTEEGEYKPAYFYRHLLLGALAIFVYVGGEVSIGSFLVSFLTNAKTGGFDEVTAGKMVSLYWGGAMVGRFAGSAIMQRMAGNKILVIAALAAAALLLGAMGGAGVFAVVAILSIGLFNSVMFPTIFTLSLRGLGKATGQGSGILCTAIVGGAIIPVLQGILADRFGLQLAFILPLLCYAYIAWYAGFGYKLSARPI